MAIVFPGGIFLDRVVTRCLVSMEMSTKIYKVAILVADTGIKQLCA